ncbi:hypothetical protein KCU95_g3015, partial [Aureobasidium melanogenum]
MDTAASTRPLKTSVGLNKRLALSPPEKLGLSSSPECGEKFVQRLPVLLIATWFLHLEFDDLIPLLSPVSPVCPVKLFSIVISEIIPAVFTKRAIALDIHSAA